MYLKRISQYLYPIFAAMDNQGQKNYEVLGAWLLIGGIVLVVAGNPWAMVGPFFALVCCSRSTS